MQEGVERERAPACARERDTQSDRERETERTQPENIITKRGDE